MRFEVGIEELLHVPHTDVEALRIARRNSLSTARVLSIESFGFLVQTWNALDHLERHRRHQYCVDHAHRYVRGPYSGQHVCQRCLASYEGAA